MSLNPCCPFLHCIPSPCIKTGIPCAHILTVSITGKTFYHYRDPVLLARYLFSKQGFPCTPMFYPVLDCNLTLVFLSKIGYGHIVPLTMNGKIFCIFYASCGIPFTLVFLSACVQRLQEPTFRMLAWMMSGRMGRVLTPLGTVYIT